MTKRDEKAERKLNEIIYKSVKYNKVAQATKKRTTSEFEKVFNSYIDKFSKSN